MKITDEAVKAFTQYRRSQVAELRPWQPGDDVSGVSVSAEDAKAGSPKSGDMIARNPKNHADQWLVAAAYFAENFEPIDALSPAPVGVTDEGQLPTRAEAAAAAKLLLRCNGFDLDQWGGGDLMDDFPMDALKTLASHEPAPTVANAELQQEVETLREGIKEIAEREQSIRDNWARYEESTKARILELETDLEVANDKLRVANEALEPFAIVAEHDIGEGESDDDIFWPISNARYSMAGRLRVGHLRRARAALGRAEQ